MDMENIAALLIKRLSDGLSMEEEAALNSWMEESPAHRRSLEPFLDEENLKQDLGRIHTMKERVWEKLERVMEEGKVVPLHRKRRIKWAVAASVILLVGLGSYFLFLAPRPPKGGVPVVTTDVAAPQSIKAVITLADGRRISLDSLTAMTQGGVTVIKTADGKIVYSGSEDEVVYNTLTNPRGSKVIDMTLADGSHVWLNAGSSLTYPIAFTGRERKVSVTGEAYFEVAQDKSKPFTVSKDAMEVTVLGTHFNVNAYDDETSINVTLLEGSVKVNNTIIKPGEQAQVAGAVKVLSNVNLDEVMAWKNGKFQFAAKTDIATIMRQIARWYDVEVVYEGAVPGQRFGGEMPRNSNLSQVLEILRTSGVKFTIEGRKVTIRP